MIYIARREFIIDIANLKGNITEDINKHSVDESPLEPHPPHLVVRPADTGQVSRVLKLANDNLIPVTPQGALTGLSGASHPILGGIALTLERMNKIIEIDENNLMAIVEPGVLISEVHEATEKLGLYYPPDPGQESGSIGGNISTNAGGMRAMKYGVTRDFVNGLEIVLADGSIINTGGKNIKDSTAYSLIDLIIGSEGTLGVVTKATLRLIPRPKYTALIYAPFTSTIDAANAVKEIVQQWQFSYKSKKVVVVYGMRGMLLKILKIIVNCHVSRQARFWAQNSYASCSEGNVYRTNLRITHIINCSFW